jgi:hypothetical protein
MPSVNEKLAKELNDYLDNPNVAEIHICGDVVTRKNILILVRNTDNIG